MNDLIKTLPKKYQSKVTNYYCGNAQRYMSSMYSYYLYVVDVNGKEIRLTSTSRTRLVNQLRDLEKQGKI